MLSVEPKCLWRDRRVAGRAEHLRERRRRRRRRCEEARQRFMAHFRRPRYRRVQALELRWRVQNLMRRRLHIRVFVCDRSLCAQNVALDRKRSEIDNF